MESLLLFLITFTTPVSHHVHCSKSRLQLWLSADTENPSTNKNQALFDCHEGWKECFFIFLVVFGFFSKMLSLLHVNTTSWSKQLIWLRIFVDAHAGQSISGKIEPAMISFRENITSSKMADQNDDLPQKKAVCF